MGRILPSGIAAAVALVLLAWTPLGLASDAAVATRWNARLLDIAEAEDGLLTLKAVRTLTMAHLAMVRALGDDPSAPQRPYLASSAAHAIAVDAYPEQHALWDQILRADEPAQFTPSSRAVQRQAGRRAAEAILQERAADRWNGAGEYRWRNPAPGVYAPFAEHSRTEPDFVFGAGWARATPFTLSSPAEFRVQAPPPVTSAAYASAYEEVRRLGAHDAPERSDDQTHLALWWKDFVERSHNRLARRLIHEQDLGLGEAARALALLNASIFDAYVASFDSKFHHNHWRPYTAIRWVDDGNPATVSDPDWTNTHDHTYPFPSYPSAHGTACGAAMTVLTHVFGDDRPFVMHTKAVAAQGPGSPPMAMIPPTRSFQSFSAAADECGRSRVYLGIHFAYDSTEGVALGRRVGAAVLQRLPLPSPGEGG